MEKQKRSIVDDLLEYIKSNPTDEECMAYIYGYQAALSRVEPTNNSTVKLFDSMQEVSWMGRKFWVIEDDGSRKVLVANCKDVEGERYNDWLVDRELLEIY